MSKKKLTNKEITGAIDVLDKNTQYLYNKYIEMNSLFSLYLEYSKNTDKFNKFVKAKTEEFEKRQRSEIKKGA